MVSVSFTIKSRLSTKTAAICISATCCNYLMLHLILSYISYIFRYFEKLDLRLFVIPKKIMQVSYSVERLTRPANA